LLRAFYILLVLFIYFETFSQNLNRDNFSERVFAYICEKEVRYPHIVMQQAIIETGGFYPNNTMKKNNLFGFKKGGRVIRFNSWKESVDYYKDWQDRKYTDNNEDYYKFLTRIRYATNRKYIRHLKGTKFFKTCNGQEIIPEPEIDSIASHFMVFDTNKIISTDTIIDKKPQIANVKKSNQPKSYTVKKGDTLYEIARKNKITVAGLKKANKLSSNKIKPGLKLKIPQ
jgi:LysM repeat protein